MMRNRLSFNMRSMIAIAALAVSAAGAYVRADDGITVQGRGEAKARPTQVELTATLTGDSELAADAIVKFHDAKKKALAAIDALKNPNLAVQSDGIAINSPLDANAQQMMMRGQTVTPTQKVQVQETSRIVLSNADKLDPDALLGEVLKILDVAKDAGFVVGPPTAGSIYEMQMRAGQTPSMVSFKVPNAEGLRDQATKLAVEDAKAKAQKMADLAGVKLGRIMAVSQGEVKTDNASMSVLRMIYGSGQKADEPTKELVGTTSGDLTIHVNVAVQFEIAK